MRESKPRSLKRERALFVAGRWSLVARILPKETHRVGLIIVGYLRGFDLDRMTQVKSLMVGWSYLLREATNGCFSIT